MRIRAVVPHYPPLSLVGSWLTTHEFLAHMAAKGHDVVVTAYLSKAVAYDHDGVHVESHFRAVDVEATFGGERTDVVIGHVGDDGSSATTARKLGVPLVYMCHGGDLAEIRRKVEGASLVVFNSAALADAVAWPGTSVVAHPPVRSEAYRTTPGNRVTLVNLSVEKGSELFWELARRMPRTEFLAVRGGYGQQIMWGGHRNVLLQRVTADMITNVYGRTRILLLPSHHETWGRVGLEAAASGIPTIAHPHPGVVESLGDSAVYVDYRDVDGWVEAIEVLSDPGVWASASAAALAQSEVVDPDEQLGVFAAALEEVAACASLP